MKDQHSKRISVLYFSLAAAEGLAALVYLLSIPADPKNVILLGLSLPRLLAAAGLLAAFLLAGGLTLSAWREAPGLKRGIEKVLGQKRPFYLALGTAGLLGAAGWLLSFMPGYRFMQLEPYFIRLQPLIYWITLVGLQTVFFLLAGSRRLHWTRLRQALAEQKPGLLLGLAFLAASLAVWAWVALSGVGLQPDMFWNKAGVPLLGLQVLPAWAAGLLVLAAGIWRKRPAATAGGGQTRLDWIDLGISLGLWILTALLWLGEPLPHNHFAPGPYPPNHVNYPYSDAAVYDICAQSALIGKGLCFGQYVDKPLYSVFLLILHLLSGRDYSLVIAFQVVVMALLPVVLYWMGKALHSRAAGVTAGLLAAFKGANAIAATLLIWDVSNPKFMMSEYPMALALAVFCLAAVDWLKSAARPTLAALAAGGWLGLASFIRHNAWFLLPVIPAAALLPYGKRWREWAKVCLLFILVLFVTIAPWMWRSSEVDGEALYFLIPFRTVIWGGRYEFEVEYEQPPAIEPEAAQPGQVGATPPAAAPVEPAKQRRRFNILPNLVSSFGRLAAQVSNHFVHNLTASVFTLPSFPLFDDLKGAVSREQPDSLWSAEWDGQMSAPTRLMLVVNLLILAAGVGSAGRRWKTAGALPLLVYLVYNAGISVARTSGGRYIVPMDWVVYFYYAIGLVQLAAWGAALLGFSPPEESREEQAASLPAAGNSPPGFGWKRAALLAFAFLLAGALAPLSELIFPERYPSLKAAQVLDKLEQEGALAQTGFQQAQLEEFLSGRGATLLYGRALYPRYLDPKDDKIGEVYNYLPKQEPQLVFTLINSQGSWLVRLPLSEPPARFPDDLDVAVAACRGDYLEARAVWLLDAGTAAHERSPEIPLSCEPEK